MRDNQQQNVGESRTEHFNDAVSRTQPVEQDWVSQLEQANKDWGTTHQQDWEAAQTAHNAWKSNRDDPETD